MDAQSVDAAKVLCQIEVLAVGKVDKLMERQWVSSSIACDTVLVTFCLYMSRNVSYKRSFSGLFLSSSLMMISKDHPIN